MQEVTMVLWRNRDDAGLVQVLSEMMAKFSDEKTTFDAMEFYLPQLAHMLIHLDGELPASAIENFALIACQQSLHLALQLEWIVIAALEDYAPELADGSANPLGNTLYFARCAKLLQDIERCVVYGNRQNTVLEDMYSQGYLSKQEFAELEVADRRYAAVELASSGRGVDLSGVLMCKRGDPEENGGPRRRRRKHKWMRRHFEIRDRMLLCYRDDKYRTLKRAVQLDGATVAAGDGASERSAATKHFPHYFELRADTGGAIVTYKLRAVSEEQRDTWIATLHRWAEAPPVAAGAAGGAEAKAEGAANGSAPKVEEAANGSAPNIEGAANGSAPKIEEAANGSAPKIEAARAGEAKDGLALYASDHQLTEPQAVRYAFYHQQRQFIRSLTDICEDLRFVELGRRDALLERKLEGVRVPEVAYLPLCRSTDAWAKVLRITPRDHHAFSTRARCPCLVTFEVALERDLVDVANYLHQTFGANLPAVGAAVPPGGTPPAAAAGAAPDAEGGEPEGGEGGTPQGTTEGTPQGTPPGEGLAAQLVQLASSTLGLSLQEEGGTPLEGTPPEGTPSEGTPPEGTPPQRRETASSVNSASSASSFGGRLRRRLSRPDVWKSGHRRDFRFPLDLRKLGHRIRGGSAQRRAERGGGGGRRGGGGGGDGGAAMPEAVRERAYSRTSYGEAYAQKRSRIHEESPFRGAEGWDLTSVIFKSNDDLRQEVFVMQLIRYYSDAWAEAGLDLWTLPYCILSTSQSTGAIQVVPNAISLDGLKKRDDYPGSLDGHFRETYAGDAGALEAARRAFIQSLAGYSLLQYALLIKDRHNGNIMLDYEGHIIHIDFGFVFGLAPGKAFSMELSCPFKLTEEYVAVMGGVGSPGWAYFRQLLVDGLRVCRRQAEVVETLMEIMAHQSRYPCFQYLPGETCIRRLRQRLHLDRPDEDVPAIVDQLLRTARNHWGTRQYDKFQKWSNGLAI